MLQAKFVQYRSEYWRICNILDYLAVFKIKIFIILHTSRPRLPQTSCKLSDRNWNLAHWQTYKTTAREAISSHGPRRYVKQLALALV